MVLEFTSSHKVWKQSSLFMLTVPKTPDQMQPGVLWEVRLRAPPPFWRLFLPFLPTGPGHCSPHRLHVEEPSVFFSSAACASSLSLCPTGDTCPSGKTPAWLLWPCKPGYPYMHQIKAALPASRLPGVARITLLRLVLPQGSSSTSVTLRPLLCHILWAIG